MLLELDRGDGVTTMICVCLLEIHGKCYYYSKKKQVNMINSKKWRWEQLPPRGTSLCKEHIHGCHQ